MKVVIVGGGLVGALAAIKLKQRGNDVYLYEQRADLRKAEVGRGRSINLALSARGIAALKSCGVFDKVKDTIIPMYGRMLHSTNGKSEFVPYGQSHQCINSIDRLNLNQILLDEAERLGAHVFFEMSLHQADFDSNRVLLKSGKEGEIVTVDYDLCVGADGAYSAVRRQVMRKTRMDFAQKYIDHGYLELSIDGKLKDGKMDYQMAGNCLHIWPRHEFMMIALPNVDKSFTVTLFMEFDKFEKVKTRDDLRVFFQKQFPDALELMGEDLLNELFFKNPIGSLISVKCSPYNYKNAVFIGDSSHAMVPFYGQGMNSGFEDVLVLDSALFGPHEFLPKDSQPNVPKDKSVEEKLAAYSKFRHADATAICDLSLYNYFEMSSNVVSVGYRVRKYVEGFLHRLVPSYVIPLYTMVSFSQIRYSVVIEQWKRQTRYLQLGGIIGMLSLLSIAGLKLIKYRN